MIHVSNTKMESNYAGFATQLIALKTNMPKYDYRCFHCDLEQEFDLPFKHWPPICAKCGLNMLKIYRAPGIVFRGTGWYRTDNR